MTKLQEKMLVKNCIYSTESSISLINHDIGFQYFIPYLETSRLSFVTGVRTRAIKQDSLNKERLAFPQVEISDYADLRARGQRSSETSNVSKFERAVQYISMDGKTRSSAVHTAKSETAPPAVSIALALSRRAATMRPR